jgi:hypothetical protein
MSSYTSMLFRLNNDTQRILLSNQDHIDKHVLTTGLIVQKIVCTCRNRLTLKQTNKLNPQIKKSSYICLG